MSLYVEVSDALNVNLYLIYLKLSSQRWKKEQQKMEAMSAASGHTFSYMNKQAATTYRLTMDDRMRWAQIAEAMANNVGYATNYYAVRFTIESIHYIKLCFHFRHLIILPQLVNSIICTMSMQLQAEYKLLMRYSMMNHVILIPVNTQDHYDQNQDQVILW